MKSLKCPKCNLITSADAEFCKQCGLNLKESSPFDKTNLFTCPDCQNLCSKTAPTCPSCGRVFNAAPVYITQPPKKTSSLAWFVLLVILAIPILCCLGSSNKTTTSDYSTSTSSASQANNRTIPNNSSGRQIVVNGLKQMAIEGGNSVSYDMEGTENKTLSIKSSNLESIDCLRFSVSDYGTFAASKGFDKVICRNNMSGEQWSHTLTP